MDSWVGHKQTIIKFMCKSIYWKGFWWTKIKLRRLKYLELNKTAEIPIVISASFTHFYHGEIEEQIVMVKFNLDSSDMPDPQKGGLLAILQKMNSFCG